MMIEALSGRLEAELGRLVAPREQIVVKLRGAFSEGLVCTSSRVMVLKSGFMTGQLFGTATFQLPYAQIAGVQVTFHLFTGYFEISAGGMQNTPKSFWNRDKGFNPATSSNCVSIAGRGQANRFRTACAVILEQRGRGVQSSRPDDNLATLERLSRLRSSGVLSESEFAAMKKRLMGSL
jgi:hypothetical protein